MNLIPNKLIVSGEGAREFVATILKDPKGQVEFSRAIPPPKHGGETFKGEWCLRGWAAYYANYGDRVIGNVGERVLDDTWRAMSPAEQREATKLAVQYRENTRTLGATSLEPWQDAMWGSRWFFGTPDPRDTSLMVYFQTLKSVTQGIGHIAERYPHLNFSFTYCEGGSKIKGSRYVEGRATGSLQPPAQTKEWYRAYVDLWGEKAKRLFIKNGSNYIKIA